MILLCLCQQRFLPLCCVFYLFIYLFIFWSWFDVGGVLCGRRIWYSSKYSFYKLEVWFGLCWRYVILCACVFVSCFLQKEGETKIMLSPKIFNWLICILKKSIWDLLVLVSFVFLELSCIYCLAKIRCYGKIKLPKINK